MASLIIDVLPFAAGVFASPLPVILAIVLLFTPRPRQTSGIYVVTWVLGLLAVTILFTLLAGALQDQSTSRTWMTWVRIVLGLALVALAIKTWLGRSAKQMPSWLAGLMQAGPKEAVRFGVLLSAANPKELLMAMAAGVAIGTSGAGVAAAGGAIIAFVLIGGLSVILPMVIFLMGGEGALERLGRARQWLEVNNAAVASVVLAALGLWLVVGGVLKL